MTKKKERNYNFLAVILAVFTVFIMIGVVVYFVAYRPLKEKAVDKLAQEMLESQISSEDSVSASDMIDSMSEEDQATLDDLIDKHITPSTAIEASKYLTSNDTEGLKDYAKSILSDEEMDEVRELYKKYKDEIPSDLQ